MDKIVGTEGCGKGAGAGVLPIGGAFEGVRCCEQNIIMRFCCCCSWWRRFHGGAVPTLKGTLDETTLWMTAIGRLTPLSSLEAGSSLSSFMVCVSGCYQFGNDNECICG